MASASETSSLSQAMHDELPISEVPGDCGLPFFGSIRDRMDYFYFQGKNEYFRSRMVKYKSTVFRSNMPPGRFISSDSRVVVLLDGKSFPVLFDMSKVEKKNVFNGTYVPSTKLMGGYRVLAYLDPSEPNHEKLKNLVFYLLQSRRDHFIPEFHLSFTELFDGLETTISAEGKASFAGPNQQASFNFLSRSLFGIDPIKTKLGTKGPSLIQKWVFFQIAPVLSLGLPFLLDDLLLHNFLFPSFLMKSDYRKLYDFFYESSGSLLEEAEKSGLPKEEACHNILYAICFNAFGGMVLLFPIIVKWVGLAGVTLHTQLAEEIRAALKSKNEKATLAAMEEMPLMKSTVYEVLRIEPKVAFQYARAKKDLVIESHDAAFRVKKGELLFGYQPFATKDPKLFEKPEEFVADRFVGENEKLLKYVLWSNGPETENPSVGNKQCAGKNLVVLMCRLFLVEFFRRYDTLKITVKTASLGDIITIESLIKTTL